MAIAITEDFVTKSGLVVQGTGTVTSSTGQTTAFQAYSGAAIAKNLIVGTTATIGANLSVNTTASIGTSLTVGTDVTINRDLSVSRNTRLVTVTATGIVSITSSTAATTASTGALVVTGGIYSNNLVIGGTTANTATTINNALYVAGGVGIGKSLVVDGKAVFKDDVVFIGSSTFVYSVNSVYTDNLLEIHVPPTPATAWTLDDGKDVGLRFHYYAGGDQNAALILAHDTKYLEWYNTGSENGSGDIVGGTYGTFKTGAIRLVGGTASIGTDTGDLTVTGGAGIGQSLNVGTTVTSPLFIGNLTGVATTATNIAGGAYGELVYQNANGVTTFLSTSTDGYVLKLDLGLPTWAPISTVIVDYANTATNLKYGADMEIPYQVGEGQTEFSYNLRYDYGSDTLRTVNAVFTGTTNASSTDSGTLQIVGGVGIGKNLWVGGNETILGDLEVRGGDITTTQSSFNLINSTANTVNFAGAGTAITIGAATGFTNIRTQVTLTNLTTATSTVTGALTVAGGVGIGGNLYIGGTSTVSGDILPSGTGISLGSADFPFADLHLSGNSLYVGSLTISSNGSSLVVTSSAGPANLTSPFITATTGTNSVSTNSGALQVVGGAGIGKDLWIGGNAVVNGGNISTLASTFNIVNNTATTVNFAGEATAVTIGSNTGYTEIRNLTTVTSTVDTSDANSGALQVRGGVGVAGSMFVGNTITATNLVIKGAYATSYLGNFGSLYIDGSSGNQLIQGSTNSLANGIGMWTAGTPNSVVYSSGGIDFATGKTLRLNNTPTGGVTRVSIGSTGNVSMTAGTSSTNISTGTLVVTGGVGISGALYVGTSSYINNSLILTQANVGNFGITSLTAGTDTVVTASTGDVTIWNNSTLQTITDRGNATTNQLLVSNATDATSTNTGALQVVGGVGIGKSLAVGNTATILGTAVSVSTTTGALRVVGGVGIGGDMYIKGTIYGVATTGTNLSNGTVGQIPFQTNTGTTGFFGPGTSGQILLSAGTTATGHVFVNTSSFVVGYSTSTIGGTAGALLYQSAANKTAFINIGAADTFLSSNGSTATFVTTGSMFVGRADLANNVVGGLNGSLLYQSAANVTTSLPIGDSGLLLQSNGTTPEWVSVGSLSAGTAANVSITTDNSSATSHYITFVNTASGSTGINVSAPSGITYVPATGNLGIGINTATTRLDVNGGTRISGITTVTNTTAASSTNSGALQVVGGVGIGGTAYIGGNANVTGNGTFTGDIAVNGGDITTNKTTFNLINAVSTSVNFAGAGTAISIGASSGLTTINHNLTVVGNLTVQGTSTIVDSTVTNITDPILTLGGLANNQPLITNDNKDKGIAFKYYSGSAKTGFFGYIQSTGFFTFVPDATITTEQVTGTKGSIDVNIAGGSAQSLVYQSSPNTTAFLSPGVAGQLLQTNGAGSAPTWVSTGSLSAGTSNTATNVAGGSVGQILFQIGVGRTGFASTGTSGQLLVSQGSTSTGPIFVSTSSIRIGYATTASEIVGGSVGQLVFQSSTDNTSFVNTGTTGQLLVSQGSTSTGPIFVNTSSIQVGYSANILNGAAGQLVYQSGPSATSFAAAGSAGQILVSGGTGAPVFHNTSSFWVGYSVNATNIQGGSTGSVVYQSATGTTALLAPGVSGYLLQTNGPGQSPTWASPSGLTAANAVTSTNIAFGTAGQIPYQTAPGLTGFVSTGTAGNVLVSNGTGAPTYNNTLTLTSTIAATSTTTGALQVVGGVGIGGNLHVGGTLYAVAVTGNITTATNLSAGSAGTLAYQSATGVTGYVAAGVAGQLLVSAGTTSTGPVFTNTASITVGYSINSTNVLGGSTGSVHYQSATGVTAMLAASTAGYVLQTNGTGLAPSWTSSTNLIAGSANSAAQIQTVEQASLAAYYPTFVNSNNSTTSVESLYTTNTFIVNPGTREISVNGTGRFTTPVNGTTGAVVLRSNPTNTATTYLQWTDNTSTIQYAAIGVTVANTITFITSSTEVMRIESGGNVGIGTIAPTRLLTLSGSGVNNRVQVNNIVSGKNFSFYAADDGTSVINYGTAAPLLFTQSGTEFMRITTNGGIAFGGSANYGSNGQILVSTGDSSPLWTSISGLSAGTATTATNLNNGLAGQIPYQTAPGQTGFVSTGTAGNVLVSNGSSAPTYNNTLTLASTIAATNTTTGALQVRGGVGVGGSVYVGNRVGFVNTGNVSTVYQYYNATTNSLDTVFG